MLGLFRPQNRPQFRAFLAVTLDGYVAAKNGDVAFLTPFQERAAGTNEDGGYAQFTADCDAILLGRKSLETVLGFEGVDWPYKAMKAFCWTSTLSKPPISEVNLLHASDPLAASQHLHQAGMTNVYVDGAQVVRSFIDAGLLDVLVLTTVPVILGPGPGGVKLFDGLVKSSRPIELTSCEKLPIMGTSQCTYKFLEAK